LLSVLFVQGKGSPWFAAAVPLVISGAAGNLVDRVRQGYVVDFIRFYWKDWEYPTFNVADIAITFGVICLVADAIADWRSSKKSAGAAKPPATGTTPDESATDTPKAEPGV
jgi:signal peptidase II